MKIEFLIDARGELYDFKTSEEEEEIEELTIPSIVKDIKVESIADLRNTFWDLSDDRGVKKIKKLIIENGIKKIAKCAFAGIGIEISTVCWPKTCKEIPSYCFSYSKIKNIVGVEEVEELGKGAFQDTWLNTFNWPSKCCCIPTSCFENCVRLERIDGMEQVEDIGDSAFELTKLKYFSWPASVSATKTCLFLSGCEHLEEIIFEGTVIKEIDLECFSCLKDVKKIDLSRCGAVNLLNTTDPKYAEVKGKLILPYYVTEVS